MLYCIQCFLELSQDEANDHDQVNTVELWETVGAGGAGGAGLGTVRAPTGTQTRSDWEVAGRDGGGVVVVLALSILLTRPVLRRDLEARFAVIDIPQEVRPSLGCAIRAPAPAHQRDRRA